MTTIDQFMAAIRQVESGGRYNIGKNGSGASGAYQFIDSTWGGYGGYSSAYLAPPEAQDAKARELMQAYYDQFGDWDHVAAAWIGGPGTAAKGPGAWGGISDSNMSVSSYVARVNAALGGPVGTGTPASTGHLGAVVQPVATQDQTASGLLGALGSVGGKDYAALKSSAGDTLDDRLSAIHQILMAGGPTDG